MKEPTRTMETARVPSGKPDPFAVAVLASREQLREVLDAPSDGEENDYVVLDLAGFLNVLRHNSYSASTPIEGFICDLVAAYNHGPLTPQDIQREFDRCRRKFNGCIRIARRFAGQYPGLVKGAVNNSSRKTLRS